LVGRDHDAGLDRIEHHGGVDVATSIIEANG
jgi:hypothetical protein